jgi:hypothetical protein
MAPSIMPQRGPALSSRSRRIARESLVGGSSGVDPELRQLAASARPTPRDVISLWPANQQAHLVLWIRRDEAGKLQICARMRDVDLGRPDLTREVQRIRGDIPVVFELDGGRTVVVPWRSLGAAP